MSKIGLAVVGSGYIAKKVIREISEISNVISIYSTNNLSSLAFANKYNAKCCASFDEILLDKNIDCVYIATPHTSHYHYASLSINEGKSVICEKPITINQIQLQNLLLLAQEKNNYFTETMWFRFSPVFYELKRIINFKTFGELQSVKANIGFDAFALPKRKRLLNHEVGGGALFDIGVYLASLCEFVFDELFVECCDIDVELFDNGVDINDKVSAYINGVYCDFECSFNRVLATEAVFEFDNGTIIVPYFFRPSKLIYNSGVVTKTLYEHPFSYRLQFESVFRDIKIGNIESEQYSHKSILTTSQIIENIRKHAKIIYDFDLVEI